MKKLLFVVAGIFCMQEGQAQLKTTTICPAFKVDILDGKINDLYINAGLPAIKKAFPCYTSIDEGTGAACGSNVFYKDRDIYCYTGREYIEIREKFKGTLTIPLMGAARNGLYKWLGHPKIKDLNWDAFQTAYGSLIAYYNKAGKINKLQLSTKSTDALQLCE
jgi:hypothetical protein